MRWRRVAVRGPSMSPALRDGDVVLVRFGAPVAAGDVVLVRWAARPGQLSVKRAVRPVDGGGGCTATTRSARPTPATLGPGAGGRRASASGCGRGRRRIRAGRRRRATGDAGVRVGISRRTRQPTSGRAATSAARPEGPSGTASGSHPRASGAPASGARAAPATTRIEECRPMTIDATLPATAPAPTTDEIMAAHVGRQAPDRPDRAPARRPRPGHLLHARCGGGQPGHRRRRRARRPLHVGAAPRRRGQRRHRGARSRRHRPARRAAGDGGQVGAVQDLRRARLDPAGARHRRTSTRSSRPSCGCVPASVR